jgi:hypothetical protein
LLTHRKKYLNSSLEKAATCRAGLFDVQVRIFGNRLMAGQHTLAVFIKVRILVPEVQFGPIV